MKCYKTIKAAFSTVLVLLFSLAAHAQDANTVDMADEMRSNGKIYVVVAVLTIIFSGIVIYLISLNRKLNRLEKLIETKK